jgi:hypothetical protein
MRREAIAGGDIIETCDRKAAILYSGGSDSTLVAALAAKEGLEEIHLLTYHRVRLLRPPEYPNVTRLREKFRGVRFIHVEIDVDGLFLEVARGDVWGDLRRHGLYVMALCAPCKIALHIRTAVYCLEHGIFDVRDGSNNEVRYDPSQRKAGREELKTFYSSLGISHTSPLAQGEKKRGRSDHELQSMGLNPVMDVKETVYDVQGSCSTICVNDLYSFGVFGALNRPEGFEEPTRRYFGDKLRLFLPEIVKISKGLPSRIDGLIEDDIPMPI